MPTGAWPLPCTPPQTGCLRTRCCCNAPAACASASCATWNWTACTSWPAGQGVWLKVPLGKLGTERMLPLDEETVALVDRIVTHRSPGRPLRHPRTGRPVEFLLTHHGKRLSPEVLRAELARAASKAGLGHVTPHQLRHTYATALVNAGVSLQCLMVLLGHVSAEMSLRYGRLFDQTVRTEYERALILAKQQLGPVLPPANPVMLTTDWRQAPAIKARLAGGFCIRAEAQGPAPTPTSASTAPTSAPIPPTCRCWPPNAWTPRHWPPTPTGEAGWPRPNATIASSPASTCS
jgi:Phage integrase family